MLLDFHDRLRKAGLPVSLTEWLTLMHGLSVGLGTMDIDRFYSFARLALIKNEAHYDRFDQVFSDYWSGQAQQFDDLFSAADKDIPDDWLKQLDREALSEEQRRQVESLGGWDKLMETLAERLREQKEAHHGGNRWIGTGGTSPFGHGGYNPEAVSYTHLTLPTILRV